MNTVRLNKNRLMLFVLVVFVFGLLFAGGTKAMAGAPVTVTESEVEEEEEEICYEYSSPTTGLYCPTDGFNLDVESETCSKAVVTRSCPQNQHFYKSRLTCDPGWHLIGSFCFKIFHLPKPATLEVVDVYFNYSDNGQVCLRPNAHSLGIPPWARDDFNTQFDAVTEGEEQTTYVYEEPQVGYSCSEGEDLVETEQGMLCQREVECEEPDPTEVAPPTGPSSFVRIYTVLGNIGDVSWKHNGYAVYNDLFELIVTDTDQWRELKNDEGKLVVAYFSDLIIDESEVGPACEWTVWQNGAQVAGFIHVSPLSLEGGGGELSVNYCDQTSP